MAESKECGQLGRHTPHRWIEQQVITWSADIELEPTGPDPVKWCNGYGASLVETPEG